MDIGYVWNQDKYEQVQKDHRVRFDEVVAVFEDENVLDAPDPQRNQGRRMAVGKTRQGRILQVIYTNEDAPLLRVITAFEASKEWKNEYVQ